MLIHLYQEMIKDCLICSNVIDGLHAAAEPESISSSSLCISTISFSFSPRSRRRFLGNFFWLSLCLKYKVGLGFAEVGSPSTK